jgi:D-arabinose 1-dehydrogenase-like Zn-dependent alcohol dehydrogenase
MISYDVAQFGAPLQRFERPTPRPQGTEVLVRTLAAGVCHSDLHLWEGGYDLGSAGRLSVADRGVTLPLTMGHEIAGEVEALGPAAADVTVGGKYLVFPWIGCGDCPVCRSGDEQLCLKPQFLGIFRSGGYGDHVLVPHPRYLIPLGDLSPAEAAPYACSGVTTFGALRKLAGIIEERPIVVIGAGGLGLMCLTLLRTMAAKGAVVVDIDAKKRQAALAAGALAAVDGAAPDAAAQVAAGVGGSVLGVIDYVGASGTARFGFDLLAKGGKLVIVGLFGGELTLPLPPIPMRAVTIQGSYVGNLQELKDLMALVNRAKIARIPITTRPQSEADAALQDLRSGNTVGRCVLVP